ncbi:efflux RND transporter periplasmic adaptor subunit [bacterium]|nr:efflux RND transporter periplasmic adaptor subunit [bacterium]
MQSGVSGYVSSATRLILAAFLVVLPACGKNEGRDGGKGGLREAQTPVPVKVAPVAFAGIDEIIKIVGTLYGREELTISAKVAGQIRQVKADMGDRVPPGALLAQIDPTNYQLAVNECQTALDESLSKLGLKEVPTGTFNVDQVRTVERAKFQAENAKARYERGRKLNTQKPPVMSDQELGDLETAYSVARSDYEVAQLEARSQLAAARLRNKVLETARQKLADTQVSAPGAESMQISPNEHFAVTKRYVSAGNYVSIGDAMFDLILDDPIKFRATVPELHLAKVKLGQPVLVRVESYPEAFKGTVSRINPAIDRVARTFEIEVAVANPDRKLRPGAFAKGDLLAGKVENVPHVPAEAVVSFAGIDRVFSPEGDKAGEHIVQVGEAVGGRVPVLGGLGGVKSVIVSGNTALRDGSRIDIKK